MEFVSILHILVAFPKRSAYQRSVRFCFCRQARRWSERKQRASWSRHQPARPVGWRGGVFWTSTLAFGGVFIIRAGRWALLLLDPFLPGAVAVLSPPGTFERVSLAGGGEEGEGVVATERFLAVLLVSVACYTLAGFAFVRRLTGHRLVSILSFCLLQFVRFLYPFSVAPTFKRCSDFCFSLQLGLLCAKGLDSFARCLLQRCSSVCFSRPCFLSSPPGGLRQTNFDRHPAHV